MVRDRNKLIGHGTGETVLNEDLKSQPTELNGNRPLRFASTASRHARAEDHAQHHIALDDTLHEQQANCTTVSARSIRVCV